VSGQASEALPARFMLRRGSGAAPLVILLLAAGVFIGTLDQTVVVTVLPKIIDDLGLPVSRFGEAAWIVSGYLLGYAIALPIAGSLADAYGHVRVFLACMLVLICGSAAVAMATSVPMLAAARIVQALGGGGVLPAGMAIAADLLPPSRRPPAFGLLAAANSASSLLGPLWGAVLAGFIGWRGIFWLNIPLILPILCALAWLLRMPPPPARRRLDVQGAALFITAIVGATFALTDDGANPRSPMISLAFGLLALVAAALLVRWELRCQQPLLRLRSFAEPAYAAAMLIYLLIGGALIVALVDVPLMRNLLFGGQPLGGGFDLMRLLLMLAVGGFAGGLLSVRIGYRATAVAGLCLAIAGFLLVCRWPARPSAGEVWQALGAIGFGLGLCDAPIFSSVLQTARAQERGSAAGLLLVLSTCGMIAGLGLLGTQGLSNFSIRAARLFREQGTNLDPAAVQHVLRQVFNATLLGAAVALIIALGLAFLLRGGRDKSWHWTPVTGLHD
jgi:MFS family permease